MFSLKVRELEQHGADAADRSRHVEGREDRRADQHENHQCAAHHAHDGAPAILGVRLSAVGRRTRLDVGLGLLQQLVHLDPQRIRALGHRGILVLNTRDRLGDDGLVLRNDGQQLADTARDRGVARLRLCGVQQLRRLADRLLDRARQVGAARRHVSPEHQAGLLEGAVGVLERAHQLGPLRLVGEGRLRHEFLEFLRPVDPDAGLRREALENRAPGNGELLHDRGVAIEQLLALGEAVAIARIDDAGERAIERRLAVLGELRHALDRLLQRLVGGCGAAVAVHDQHATQRELGQDGFALHVIIGPRALAERMRHRHRAILQHDHRGRDDDTDRCRDGELGADPERFHLKHVGAFPALMCCANSARAS
jgi:hypothetical protein